MCGALLHQYTAVRDRNMPDDGGRGGVHCSIFCSVSLHNEPRGFGVHQVERNSLTWPSNPPSYCMTEKFYINIYIAAEW